MIMLGMGMDIRKHSNAPQAQQIMWRSVVLLAVLAGATFGSAADEPRPASAFPDLTDKAIIGEIICPGPVSYRTGVGPWLSQPSGTFPVATPLQIRTYETHCRIQLGTQSLFEAAPSSNLSLLPDESGVLTLSLKGGSVLYALSSDAVLKVALPSAKMAARVGNEEAVRAPVSQAGSAFSSARHVGIIQMDTALAATFSNLKGSLLVTRSGAEAQRVPSGQLLRMTADSTSRPVSTSLRRFSGTIIGPASDPKTKATSRYDSQAIGSWWVFQSNSAEPASLDPAMVVTAPKMTKDLQFFPPEVRRRVSPWRPPGRRREITPDNGQPEPPWEPPGRPR
jgi:hypothetical protein